MIRWFLLILAIGTLFGVRDPGGGYTVSPAGVRDPGGGVAVSRVVPQYGVRDEIQHGLMTDWGRVCGADTTWGYFTRSAAVGDEAEREERSDDRQA